MSALEQVRRALRRGEVDDVVSGGDHHEVMRRRESDRASLRDRLRQSSPPHPDLAPAVKKRAKKLR